MGFALFALSSIAKPLRPLLRMATPTRTHAARPGRECAMPAPAPRAPAAAPRPLRVILNRDDEGACRLVISGRMADVCAELDRLALLH